MTTDHRQAVAEHVEGYASEFGAEHVEAAAAEIRRGAASSKLHGIADNYTRFTTPWARARVEAFRFAAENVAELERPR